MTATSSVSLENRPDVTSAALQIDAANAAARQARALLLPHVGVEGGYEWNGATWADRSAAWMIGVRGELSLSLGGGAAARARAAGHAVERARAQKTSVERAAQVDLLAGRARLDAALAREDIAIGAISHARESERIIRERYEAGLASVNDVLHAADAILAAESLETTSHVDALVATVMLERALGRTPGSPRWRNSHEALHTHPRPGHRRKRMSFHLSTRTAGSLAGFGHNGDGRHAPRASDL